MDIAQAIYLKDGRQTELPHHPVNRGYILLKIEEIYCPDGSRRHFTPVPEAPNKDKPEANVDGFVFIKEHDKRVYGMAMKIRDKTSSKRAGLPRGDWFFVPGDHANAKYISSQTEDQIEVAAELLDDEG